MARNTKNTEVVEDQEVVSQNAEQDQSAVEEFDAATDASAGGEQDLFFAQFTVVAQTVLNSPARNALGEAVTFNVTRQRKGSYVASIGEATGRESRKPDVAVKRAIEAVGQRPAEFIFDAKAAEDEKAPMPENTNQPNETWFFDNPDSPQYKATEEVTEQVIEADRKFTGAEVDTKEAGLMFGRAYNRLKLIFADAGLAFGGDGEQSKRGNTAWGIFLRSARFAGLPHVEKILASKNAAAQHGNFASAPKEVVDAFPNVNTASTFERKVNEATTVFAEAVAQTVLVARKDSGNDSRDLDVATALEAATKKHEKRIADYNEALKAWNEVARANGEEGKPIPKFTKAGDKADNLVIGWLLDAGTFENSKLHKAIVSAWDEEVNAPTEEERETAAAEKATTAIKKKFAEMSEDEAARHLLAILMAHGEPVNVYDALGDMLHDALTKRETEAAAAKEAAEKAASEAA